MLFSIIIPAYNAASSLPETLSSIYQQTYDGYEIILINDGSADATESVCKVFCESHNNTHYVRQNNMGVYEARRKGAEISAGDYLVFVDADDSLRFDTLSILAREIDKCNPDIICFSYTRNPDYSNDPFINPALPSGIYEGDDLAEVRKCLARGKLNSIWGKAIKRNCLIDDLSNTDTKRIDFAEDFLQMIPIVDSARSVLQISDALYYYNCQNGQSATHSYKEKQLSDLTFVTSSLVKIAARWGEETERLAWKTRTEQYLYLLSINELSDNNETKKRNFVSISEALFNPSIKADVPCSTYRPDSYLLFLAAKNKHYLLSRVVIRCCEQLKLLILKVLS
ncbi:glycosyltransferase family 2 protein [Collinsella aerofaciens]|jgi:glycosyltransferase involved in cell wall biosynthesis|uniref:glycosyltransferase family 2 protein n=1 Tax=Collinsella aerofaciens TaxID=74426 RepID=UPI0006C41099|nr:glycosyltransferase family 2 protein [Collinsella aerofaciens]CUN98604.1 PGL/p-HBAD biosynthesis glycosyltransferase Rv2957/MT3031 [Collinsella aerofaciens]HJI45468.1 glycosyltransferase [Coriobacteriaceae bacterium]